MLVFVDCEAYGGAPATGQLTDFGAVADDEVHDALGNAEAFARIMNGER